MCYNCGCQSATATGGDSRNITDKTFEEAAKAAGQTVQQAKENTLQLLKKQLGHS